jgi:hypothetical protein
MPRPRGYAPDRRSRREVEAGRQRQLAGHRIERQDAAGGDAEDRAGLLQDDADGPAHVEALGDRSPRLEQRARLLRALEALLEELGIVDGDAGLLGERLQHALVMGRERGRPRGERRDDAAQIAAHPQRHTQHRADALPLVHVPARRARIAADIVDADGDAVLGAPSDDALADRQGQPPPLLALEAVGGGVPPAGRRLLPGRPALAARMRAPYFMPVPM